MVEAIREKLELFEALKNKKYDLISLYSGGLDSVLATKMVLEQGLKVLALKIVLPFHGDLESRDPLLLKSDDFNIDLLSWFASEEYVNLIKEPKYGYGKNMNPCIDCKIYFFTVAKEVMEAVGAKAVVTGEVLGERPMSQNRQSIELIEKKSGLDGKILRPLTALNFEETDIEKSGLVDRSKFLDIKGRGRKQQFELAEKYKIKDYETPAGGCLLTDPTFSFRLKESIAKEEDSVLMMQLLRFGRHFRLPGGAKLVMGRNEEENMQLKDMFPGSWVKFDGIDIKGPWAGIQGSASLYDLKLAAQIWARYSQGREMDPIEMRLIYPKNKKQVLITHPLKVGQEQPFLIVPEANK